MESVLRIASRYAGIDTTLLYIRLEACGHAVAARGNDASKGLADGVSSFSSTVRAVSIAASGIPGDSQSSHFRMLHFHTCKARHFQGVGTPVDALTKPVNK